MRLPLAVPIAVGAALLLGPDRPAVIAKPGPGELVVEGKVSSITQGGSDRKPWLVSIDVQEVVSGTFTGETFEFMIHSPARAGLEIGESYTIRAMRRGSEYEVDETQWRSIMVEGAGADAAGTPLSLELRRMDAPPRSISGDPALDGLMERSVKDPLEGDIVKTTVIIHARREILVNPDRVRLSVRDLSDRPLYASCVYHWAPFEAEEKLVRLHKGETYSRPLHGSLFCYRLKPGERFVVVAEFEDGGDPFRAPPFPEVTVAMRKVLSNRLVLVYAGRQAPPTPAPH